MRKTMPISHAMMKSLSFAFRIFLLLIILVPTILPRRSAFAAALGQSDDPVVACANGVRLFNNLQDAEAL